MWPALLERAAKSHAAEAQRRGRRERDKGGLLNSRLGSRFALDRSCDPAFSATRRRNQPNAFPRLRFNMKHIRRCGRREDSHPGLARRTARAPQCEQTGRGRGRRVLHADDPGASEVMVSILGGFEGYELDRASAAHPKCCCASCIAGTLLERRQLGLSVLQLPQRGVLSMGAHLDRKQPDGAAIAFVVITLLTVIAFAILLSRLNAFV